MAWHPATVIFVTFAKGSIRRLRNVQKGVTRMCKQSLISLALISFSIASSTAAIPMDADQALLDATQSAILHNEVALVQGGNFDKDVAAATFNQCQNGAACTTAPAQNVVVGNARVYVNQSVGDWFVQGSSSALPPLVVWLIIMAGIFFFLSRKSASTK
jgi:hypothetical protein